MSLNFPPWRMRVKVAERARPPPHARGAVRLVPARDNSAHRGLT